MRKHNRSAPDAAVIPVLHYADVRAAVEWLTANLPMTERLRIGDHRAQLTFADGALIIADAAGHPESPPSLRMPPGAHQVMLRVTGVAALCSVVAAAGATIVRQPETHMYGERQCMFLDPWEHVWVLSETIHDSDPGTWGGELREP
jgi:uncharacterized glyoxalase superfamily protein PhnB